METKTTKTTTIGVIGTAGRNKSIMVLTKGHFEFMADAFKQYLDNLIKQHKEIDGTNITLVSGGAAWSDHIAVDYFLKNSDKCKLVLYLPCKIVESVSTTAAKEPLYKFEELDGKVHWSKNPGKSTNNYHSSFGKQIGRLTVNEIIMCQKLGAILDTSASGFKDRNTCISKSDFLVAFTGVFGPAPTGGGTLDTWTKSTSKFKHHITIPKSFTSIKRVLNDLEVDKNGQIEENPTTTTTTTASKKIKN